MIKCGIIASIIRTLLPLPIAVEQHNIRLHIDGLSDGKKNVAARGVRCALKQPFFRVSDAADMLSDEFTQCADSSFDARQQGTCGMGVFVTKRNGCRGTLPDRTKGRPPVRQNAHQSVVGSSGIVSKPVPPPEVAIKGTNKGLSGKTAKVGIQENDIIPTETADKTHIAVHKFVDIIHSRKGTTPIDHKLTARQPQEFGSVHKMPRLDKK